MILVFRCTAKLAIVGEDKSLFATGLSRSSAPPLSMPHAHVTAARRSSSMKADNRIQASDQQHASDAHDEADAGFAGPPAAGETASSSVVAKDSSLRPVHNGFKPGQRTTSLRPATRSAVKALPVGVHRNARRPSSHDRASRVQSVRAHATAQSVPPGVVDLIAAAQREIDAASASAEQLISDGDFIEDGLDLDIDAFLESDSIAELVAVPGQDASVVTPSQHLDVHARRAHSPAIATAQHVAALRAQGLSTAPYNAEPVPSSKADQANVTVPHADSISPTPANRSPAKPPSAPAAAAATTAPEAAATAATAGMPASSEGPPPGPAGPTAPVKDVAKNSTKQKRAHKNADAIRYANSVELTRPGGFRS